MNQQGENIQWNTATSQQHKQSVSQGWYGQGYLEKVNNALLVRRVLLKRLVYRLRRACVEYHLLILRSSAANGHDTLSQTRHTHLHQHGNNHGRVKMTELALFLRKAPRHAQNSLRSLKVALFQHFHEHGAVALVVCAQNVMLCHDACGDDGISTQHTVAAGLMHGEQDRHKDDRHQDTDADSAAITHAGEKTKKRKRTERANTSGDTYVSGSCHLDHTPSQAMIMKPVYTFITCEFTASIPPVSGTILGCVHRSTGSTEHSSSQKEAAYMYTKMRMERDE